MTDRKALKRSAREAMRETKPSAVWVTLAVGVILLVLQLLSAVLSGDWELYKSVYQGVLSGELAQVSAAAVSGSGSFAAWLLTLALDVMTMVVSLGYTLYALRLSRRQSPSFGDVFDAFGLFFRAVWISILRSVILSLWSFVYAIPAGLLSMVMPMEYALLVCLPLLIPVVMAALSYSMSEFILLDHSEFSCAQCLALSRMVMHGHKWEFFKLRLSFIGWYALCVLPPVWLWVEPYAETTAAGYYDAFVPAALENGVLFPQSRSTEAPRYHVPGQEMPEDSEAAPEEEVPEDDETPPTEE